MADQNEKLVEQVNALHAEGKSVREIARTLKKAPTTVSRIIKQNSNRGVPEASTEQQPENTETAEGTTKQRKSNTPAHSMISDERVQAQLFRAFEEQAHRDLLPLLKDEFIQKFKAGAILLHYDTLYRHDIQEIGIEWNRFIDFCFTMGYRLIMDEHIKQTFERQEDEEHKDMIQEGIKMKVMAQAKKGD